MENIRERQLRPKNGKKRNKKIIINTANDLINIPIEQLRVEDISKFSGDIFDKIYREAIEIESKKRKKPEIEKKNDYIDDSEITESEKFENYRNSSRVNLNNNFHKKKESNDQKNYNVTKFEHKKNKKIEEKKISKEVKDKSFGVSKWKPNKKLKNKEKKREKELKEESNSDDEYEIIDEGLKYNHSRNLTFFEGLNKMESDNINNTYDDNVDNNKNNGRNKNNLKSFDNSYQNNFEKVLRKKKIENSNNFNTNSNNTINNKNKNYYFNNNNNSMTQLVQERHFQTIQIQENYSNKKVNNFLPQKYKNNNLKIKKITFYIEHITSYGNEVGISGSLPSLGSWNEKKILHLKWTEGNEWVGSINILDNISEFEFKLVVLKHDRVKKWESGPNNKINLAVLSNQIRIQENGKYTKFSYEYNIDTEKLNLIYNWNN